MSPLTNNNQSDFLDLQKDPSFSIRLVSHIGRAHIPGMDHLKQQLVFQGFVVEHFEYKVLIKREIKRAINPKHDSSITEKVIVDEKIDLNTDLKYARQLVNRVNQGPENILLVHLNKAKGDYFSLPLFFSKLQKENKPILVMGMPVDVKAQLMIAPDLNFSSVPKALASNLPLLELMKMRISRKKSVQAQLRDLMDLPFFPGDIKLKINQVSIGGENELTIEESLNLLLISDLYSRYSAVLSKFETEMELRRLKVQQLSSMFCELMQNVPLKTLSVRLVPYIGEHTEEFQSLPHFFSYLYKNYQTLEGSSTPVNRRAGTKNRADLFKAIRSIFLFARSQQDPKLWQKCYYYSADVRESGVPEENIKSLYQITREIKKQIRNHRSATHNSLVEIYSIHNFAGFLKNRKVVLPKKGLSKLQFGLLKHMILPGFNIRVTKNDGISFSVKTADGKLLQKNTFSPHMLSRVYGVFISQKLETETRKFLQPGLRKLNDKFGNNFFEILFGHVVLKNALPVSRNMFAAWLQNNKMVGSLKERGWIERNPDITYEFNLSKEVLSGSGETLLPKKTTSEGFLEALSNSEKEMNVVIGRFREAAREEIPNNYYKIFEAVFQKGIYNIQSRAFRENISGSFLYIAFQNIIQEVAQTVMFDLLSVIKGNKVVLKVPLILEPMLLLGHTFQIKDKQTGQSIGIHLIVHPVKTADSLTGISKKFSSLLVNRFSLLESEKEKLLIKAAEEIQEYYDISKKYFSYLYLISIDLLMRQLVLKGIYQSKLLPKHIKHYISDDAKWFVGDLKGRNLVKMLKGSYRVQGQTKSVLKEPKRLTYGQIIEGIENVTLAENKLSEVRSSVNSLIEIRGKIPKNLVDSKEGKQLYFMLSHIKNILNTGLEHFGAGEAKSLNNQASFVKKILQPMSITNPREILYYLKKFISENSDDWESIVYSLNDFVARHSESEEGELTKVFTKAGAFLKDVKRTQCVVFFLESDKEYQLKNLIKIDKGLRLYNSNLSLFLETTSLQKSQVEFICRAFHPQHLFRVENLHVAEVNQGRELH